MLGFGRTCSYRDRTAATTMIHGDKPCFMVVRCRSVAVGMLHGRWPLPAAILAPAGGPLRSVDT